MDGWATRNKHNPYNIEITTLSSLLVVQAPQHTHPNHKIRFSIVVAADGWFVWALDDIDMIKSQIFR